MPEHPLYPRWNDSFVPESASTPFWQPSGTAAPNAEAMLTRQSKPYWKSDLSGCICNEAQKDQIIWLIYRNKGVRPILMRVAIFCEMGKITGFDAHSKPLVQPVYIGNGNGAGNDFQLRKEIIGDGYEDEPIYYNIQYPQWDYPAQTKIASTASGTIPHRPMEDVQLYSNGNPVSKFQYSVNKSTGILTTSVGGTLSVTGGFYLRMLMPASIPMTPLGGGLHQIKEGIELREQYGVF